MKIKITFTLDLNPESWAEDYDLDPKDHPAIRKDVQNYVEEHTKEWMQDRGHLMPEKVYSRKAGS